METGGGNVEQRKATVTRQVNLVSPLSFAETSVYLNVKKSLKADHDLEIDELKRNIKANEDELEEFRAKTSQLQRQLTEERIDKQ